MVFDDCICVFSPLIIKIQSSGHNNKVNLIIVYMIYRIPRCRIKRKALVVGFRRLRVISDKRNASINVMIYASLNVLFSVTVRKLALSTEHAFARLFLFKLTVTVARRRNVKKKL